MNAFGPPRGRVDRRRRRRTRLALSLLVLVAGGVTFALGLGLGKALEENPRPGGMRTEVRTLKPLPLAPARETVTVTHTVSAP